MDIIDILAEPWLKQVPDWSRLHIYFSTAAVIPELDSLQARGRGVFNCLI